MSLVNDLHHKVYVATCESEGRKYGFVLTWVTPASLTRKDPKVILVVSRFNDSARALLRERRCCLHLLAESQLREFFIFGSRHSLREDKFKEFEWRPGSSGPVLGGCAGHGQVAIEEVFETPDRYVLYGTVAQESHGGEAPLILGPALERLGPLERKALEEKMAQDSLRDEKQFLTGGPS